MISYLTNIASFSVNSSGAANINCGIGKRRKAFQNGLAGQEFIFLKLQRLSTAFSLRVSLSNFSAIVCERNSHLIIAVIQRATDGYIVYNACLINGPVLV